ncbi:MAG: GTP-binding protein, partial [Cohnella sp.]|nr:GTP-binding protein [Cohnella sp.]
MDILLALFLLLNSASGNGQQQDHSAIGKLWNTVKLTLSHDASTPQGNEQNGNDDPSQPSDPGNANDPHADPQKDAPKIKGVYVTAYSAGGERFAKLLQLVDSTDLNSMVIDIKDDTGFITYKTENETLKKMGEPKPFIKDINKLMATLQEHDVYPIARVVVFKDTILAKKHPEYSYVQKDGKVWQ